MGVRTAARIGKREDIKECKVAKCKGKTKAGKACKAEGRPETDGYCFVHWKEQSGLQPGEVRVKFLKGYKNGQVGVMGGEGDIQTISVQKLQQVRADDPHALAVYSE